MELEELHTNRLVLIKFTPVDLEKVFIELPQQEAMKLLGLQSEEAYKKEIEKSKGGYTTYRSTMVHFKLKLKTTGEVIGGCGFHNWYPMYRRAELGYALTVENYKRMGLMSEAVKAILAYGFNEMKLNRVEAFVGPVNEASLRIIKRFGFTEEGNLREHFVRNDMAEDSLVFSLLSREYEALSNP